MNNNIVSARHLLRILAVETVMFFDALSRTPTPRTTV